jgi:hypothetical protein
MDILMVAKKEPCWTFRHKWKQQKKINFGIIINIDDVEENIDEKGIEKNKLLNDNNNSK